MSYLHMIKLHDIYISPLFRVYKLLMTIWS